MNLNDKDNKEQQEYFIEIFDKFLNEHFKDDFENFLLFLSANFKAQADRQEHPVVKSCLTSVSESLSKAALDFYVSTK